VYLRADDENKKMAKPQPEKKYAQGLAFPAVRLDFSFFQPREARRVCAQKRRGLRREEKNGGVPEDMVPKETAAC